MDPPRIQVQQTSFAKCVNHFQMSNGVKSTTIRKRQRKLTPQGRLDAAQTRKRGACWNCRLKKVKCTHPRPRFVGSGTDSSDFLTSQQPVAPTQVYGEYSSVFKDLDSAGENAEASKGQGSENKDYLWSWSEPLLMRQNSTDTSSFSTEQFPRMLDTAYDPFSEPLQPQRQTEQHSWTCVASELLVSGPPPMEQQSLGSGAEHMLALSPSTEAASCSRIFQSEDCNKQLQESTADCKEEPGFTDFDEQIRAEIHLNVTPDRKCIGKETDGSLPFTNWQFYMQQPKSRKSRQDETTVNVDSAFPRLRHPCANKLSAEAQTWKCCCGRSVFRSPCTYTRLYGSQWSSQVKQSSAPRSAVTAQSPAAVFSSDISTTNVSDESKKPGSHSNRMEVFIDPPSIKTRRGLQFAMPRQDNGNQDSHVLDSQHALGPNAACLGHAHSPFSQAARTDAFLADTQDICTDYSPVAYLTNRNAPTFVTPSNKYDGNSAVASSFDLQTPSTRRYIQMPDLTFTSSSRVEETPPSIIATPVTTDTGYHGLPRRVDMFGDAARKIHFGTEPAKGIRMSSGQEEFTSDFGLFSADVADSSLELDSFAV